MSDQFLTDAMLPVWVAVLVVVVFTGVWCAFLFRHASDPPVSKDEAIRRERLDAKFRERADARERRRRVR